MIFKSWKEMFDSVLRDDPGLFYMIKYPNEESRTRFMTKMEALQFIKDRIGK